MTAQGGNAAAGFVVTIEAPSGLVHARCWGFWGAELGAAWQAEALAAAHRVRGHAWCVLFDFEGFAPQRPSVQELVRATIVKIAAFKPRYAVLVADNAITKLQLVRLLREEGCHAWSFRARGDEAVAWLKQASAEGGGDAGGR